MIRTLAKAVLTAAVAALGAGAFWISAEMNRVPGTGAPEIFTVRKGETTSVVARGLASSGVVSNRYAFLAAYRLFYAPRTLKAGEFRVRRPGGGGTVRDLLLDMIHGRLVTHPLTIPEGLTVEETRDLLRGSDVLDPSSLESGVSDASLAGGWDPGAPSLEGYLFPETYNVTRGTAAADLVAQMVRQFGEAFGDAWRRRAAELGLTVRQAVTLASLIEKETAVPAERPRVSAVFHNRMARGMRLDCDPTIIYALRRAGLYRGRLLLKDLAFASPYNTYLAAGLPPGPICSPGRASLEAALFPAAEDVLYFVAAGDGSHRFSRTLAEHNVAVREYRLKKR